jgi:hypothetical protein
MKRYKAAGSPDEFGDWIVAVAELPGEDEAGYASALRDIATATRDMDALMQLPDGEAAMHYTLRFSRDGGLDSLIHERDFWPRAVQFPALRPLIVQYIEQVNEAGADSSWQDEFHPRGSFAIAELAGVDASACPLLGKLLFRWDMGHETYQEGLIDQLIATHGMVGHTLDLLACRILADGQAIQEQVASILYDQGLRQHFDLADFARRCATRVGDSVCPDLGLDYFASIYADGDEAAYTAARAEFHAAGIEEQPMGFDADDSRERAARRSSRPQGHWNQDFLETSVEDFSADALELLPTTTP